MHCSGMALTEQKSNMTTKLKIVLTRMNEGLYEKIVSFKEARDLNTVSEAIRALCSEGIKREFPAYIEIQKQKNLRRPTAKEKAEDQMAVAEAKSAKKATTLRERGVAVCESLGGTITVPEGSEVEHCRYSMFTEAPGKKLDTVNMLVPLEDMTALALETQYRDMLGNTGPDIREKLINYK